MIGGVYAWQGVCISWSWWLLFFADWRNTVFIVTVHSKIVRRFKNRKSIAMRHRPNCWWYIRIHKCWLFFHGHIILNRGHHTEIMVSTVVARTLPPSCAVVMKSGNLNFLEPFGPLLACSGMALLWLLGTIQTTGTPNGTQCPFPFTYALSSDEHTVHHTCGAHFLSWSPTLQPKYKKCAFVIVGVIRHFLEANVTSPQI